MLKPPVSDNHQEQADILALGWGLFVGLRHYSLLERTAVVHSVMYGCATLIDTMGWCDTVGWCFG